MLCKQPSSPFRNTHPFHISNLHFHQDSTTHIHVTQTIFISIKATLSTSTLHKQPLSPSSNAHLCHISNLHFPQDNMMYAHPCHANNLHFPQDKMMHTHVMQTTFISFRTARYTSMSCKQPSFPLGQLDAHPCHANNLHFIKKVYLGYIISSNDRDYFAIQKECRAVYARGNMLLRKFKICSTEDLILFILLLLCFVV